MPIDGRIFIAGSRGLVGSAFGRSNGLRAATLLTPSRAELDLEDQGAVQAFFAREHPDAVILAAAKVGGILANDSYPADFIRSNLAIQCNVIEAAYQHGVRRLLFLGSVCAYPKFAPQPITEDQLLAGPLEPTNEPYAVAKIAGIEMCRAYNRQYGTQFLSVMPSNLYGPGDNFDLRNSHVLPALIRRFHEAKTRGDASVTLWGTGTPRREFLHVDDMAEACIVVMDKHTGNELVNIGCGEDASIRELADLVRSIVGYAGAIAWDASKPDGTPSRLLDVTRLFGYGWRPTISLAAGIEATYAWYLGHLGALRRED